MRPTHIASPGQLPEKGKFFLNSLSSSTMQQRDEEASSAIDTIRPSVPLREIVMAKHSSNSTKRSSSMGIMKQRSDAGPWVEASACKTAGGAM